MSPESKIPRFFKSFDEDANIEGENIESESFVRRSRLFGVLRRLGENALAAGEKLNVFGEKDNVLLGDMVSNCEKGEDIQFSDFVFDFSGEKRAVPLSMYKSVKFIEDSCANRKGNVSYHYISLRLL
jgi:hypothetical protein